MSSLMWRLHSVWTTRRQLLQRSPPLRPIFFLHTMQGLDGLRILRRKLWGMAWKMRPPVRGERGAVASGVFVCEETEGVRERREAAGPGPGEAGDRSSGERTKCSPLRRRPSMRSVAGLARWLLPPALPAPVESRRAVAISGWAWAGRWILCWRLDSWEWERGMRATSSVGCGMGLEVSAFRPVPHFSDGGGVDEEDLVEVRGVGKAGLAGC